MRKFSLFPSFTPTKSSPPDSATAEPFSPSFLPSEMQKTAQNTQNQGFSIFDDDDEEASLTERAADSTPHSLAPASIQAKNPEDDAQTSPLNKTAFRGASPMLGIMQAHAERAERIKKERRREKRDE